MDGVEGLEVSCCRSEGNPLVMGVDPGVFE